MWGVVMSLSSDAEQLRNFPPAATALHLEDDTQNGQRGLQSKIAAFQRARWAKVRQQKKAA